MDLSSDYNRLAHAVRRKFGVSLKWAMKIAYCLRELGSDNPVAWVNMPRSPMTNVWNPTNCMFFVTILRGQAKSCDCSETKKELSDVASELYSTYSAMLPLGAKQIAKLRDGELLYWATRYFVESQLARKYDKESNDYDDDSYYVTLELPYGLTTARLWSRF